MRRHKNRPAKNHFERGAARGAVTPTARVGRGLVFDGGVGFQLLDSTGADRGKIAEPFLALACQFYPTFIEPIDRRWHLAADFVRPAFAAIPAVTDARPECHVEAQTLEVKPLTHLPNPGSDVFPVGRIWTDQAVPAGRVDRLPRHIGDAPVGMLVRRPTIEDEAHVEHHRDVLTVTPVDHLGDDVAPL